MTAPSSTGTDRASQLYAAAVGLFMANGYREVDVAEIAAAAGASHGTFYNYFRNKRDVLTAIQRTTETELVAAVSPVDGAPQPADREEFVAELGARISRAITYFVEHADFMSFIALTAAGVDDDALAATLVTYQRAADQFTALFEHGREQGWVHRDLDLDVAGQAAVSAIVTTVLPALVGAAAEMNTEHAATLCTDYLLHGMSGLPGSR